MSVSQPQFQGQAPQPQFYPQPRKKSHRFRNFVIIPFAALIGLIVIVAVASSGGGEPTANSSSQSGSQGSSAKGAASGGDRTACGKDRNAPCQVKVGQAFTLGKHQTLGGWKVVETLGMFTIQGKVKNVSDSTSTAFFQVKFLKGDEVLGNVSCNSSELEPGQVETLNCVPDGEFSKKYDRVTAEATF